MGLLTPLAVRIGVPRSTPLPCVPHGGRLLVAGSYFGGPRQPVQVVTLEAAKHCTIRCQGRTMEAESSPVTGEERADAWQHLLGTWPNFARHEERSSREIKVFELTPARAR
jgi:deazaflavin-dependent oxidoreductase (nitroreductase family)